MTAILLFILKWLLLGVGAIVIICIILALAVVWIGGMEDEAMREYEAQRGREKNR